MYPPSQKTTSLSKLCGDSALVKAGFVDECVNASPIGVGGMDYATARCHPQAEADNCVVIEGEDG